MRRNESATGGGKGKPYDSTLKELIKLRPEDWIAFAGLPHAPAVVIDADLATVLLEADKVIRVAGAVPYILHIEVQSSYDKDMGERLLQYSVLLRRRHNLPVVSVLILLCPDADGGAITGMVRHEFPVGTMYHEFHYRVIRVWEHSAEELLAGGIALAPLAALAQDAKTNLRQVVRDVEAKAAQELPTAKAKQLMTRTYLLMGLRYDKETIIGAFEGVAGMKDSVTYQEILREGEAVGIEKGTEIGRIEEIRRVLLRLGNKRLGKPSKAITAKLQAISSLDRLEALAERLLEVETWKELLIKEA